MQSLQSQMCFVCDTEILNKGICLSIGKTFSTKTAFITKICQLIGDEFMVIVSEDDRLCTRCSSLINQSDKLEVDLKEINHVITEYLINKYHLNTEDDRLYVTEGLEHSSSEDHCEDYGVKNQHDVIQKETHQFCDGREGSMHIEEMQNSNASIKSALNKHLHIKSEPLPGNISTSAQSTSECVVTGSLEHDLVPECKPSGLIPYFDQTDPKIPQSSEEISLKEVKTENLPLDDNTDEAPSKNFKSQISRDQAFISKYSSETTNLALISDKPSEISSSCSLECSSTNYSASLQGNSVRKKSSVKSKFVRNHNTKYQKHTAAAVKLRHILPKITGLCEILPPLYIIENHSKITDLETNELIKTNETEIEIVNCDISQESIVDTESNKDILVKKRIETEKEEKQDSTSRGKFPYDKFLTKIIYKCGICGRSFKTKPGLDNHEATHTTPPLPKVIYKCRFCKRRFNTKPGLDNHEASHATKRHFYCDFCGRKYTTRGGLEEHRSSHTEQERYICEICGKRFGFQSTYWIHRKWHDNPYPYKCSDCDKFFRHSSLLAVHRRRHHTGERPHKCSYCPLTFVLSTCLKRHLILHTKDYPFCCKPCKHGFTTRSKYRDHMAKTHKVTLDQPTINKKDYKMVICDDGGASDSSTTRNTMNTVSFGNTDCEFN